MWEIDSIRVDPLWDDVVIGRKRKPSKTKPSSFEVASYILSASVPIDSVLEHEPSIRSSLKEGKSNVNRGLKVGLADFCFRFFRESKERNIGNSNRNKRHDPQQENYSIRMEGLEEALHASKRRKPTNSQRRKQPRQQQPYILERSDFYCGSEDSRLHITVRVVVLQTQTQTQTREKFSESLTIATNTTAAAVAAAKATTGSSRHHLVRLARDFSGIILERVFAFGDPSFRKRLLEHLSCLVLQQLLRAKLLALDAIAFVGDGSILPRKSGTSDAPMASPPAVPFRAPSDDSSTMTTKVSIEIDDMGSLAEYLPVASYSSSLGMGIAEKIESTLVLSGLIVPKGITLICGGGYHGKSTLLQAIAVGQYDKIPGDGRELCVSLPDAVMVRAEDGRYVNNCNISAFISNLPTPPGVTTPLDTEHFSTRDSSGSTSQAANVSEAIELGARALLVDEDISAANFMARDGRMRALVMDESITPLLYRVNGLYNSHGISTVIVVGGVGDWLDVPHQVILLDKYVVFDATAKAQSISRQFSYGHVQYGGRGVVHRLEWERKGTPKPRRPKDHFSKRFDSDVVVSLLDGGRGLVVYKEGGNNSNDDDDDDEEEAPIDTNTNGDRKHPASGDEDDCDDDDEEEGYIDASRLGQLLGKKQLFAAGLCAAWILQNSPRNGQAGLKDLLKLLDSLVEKGGMNLVLDQLNETDNHNNTDCDDDDDSGGDDNGDGVSPLRCCSKSMIQVFESVGYLERPRNFEIGQALTRMRGIRFEELPVYDDGSEEAARIEAETKKKALAALWAKRRSKHTKS